MKCYGLRFANRKEEYKIKGCSLNRTHQKLINFDNEGDTHEWQTGFYSTNSFDYGYGKGMSTREFKGKYDKDRYQLLPFEYDAGGE